MDPLEHDPKIKQQIKTALYEFVYGPVNRSFKKRIEAMVLRNTALGGFGHKHFVYKGVLYNADSTPPSMRRNRLVVQLRPEMDELLIEMVDLNQRELPYVLGFMNQVLNSSNSLKDYLQVLPESIHPPIHQLMATCPCRVGVLSPEKVERLKTTNATSVDLVKQRLITNLLI